MSENHANNDDWLKDPAPASYRAPSEEDLRRSLEGAPEATRTRKSKRKDEGNGRKDDTGKGGRGARDAGSTSRKSDGRDSGRSGRRRGAIFDNSPVTPLGIHGDLSYYLDTKGQLRGVDNHTLQKMLHVFGGRAGLLAQHFPQYDKDGAPRPGKFDQMLLSTAMIEATTERGVWSPVGRVRGAGAWTDEDGGLIFHAGNEVLIGGEWSPPGVYDGHVYPASDPVPRPAAAGARGDPGEEILELIETWNWSRPHVDPMLALGAICAQMVGGALDWRPVTWLTGDQATGKSTFQKLLRYVHGGSDGLLQASDATEAGIRSVIGYSSMPVALDELEPDDDPKKGKAAAIIRLARIAASGDQILRGSTDQKGYQGNAYSCFLFSSILVPPLPPQDRSRLILLDLNRLDQDAPKPKDDPRRLRALGAGLRRRLIDGWPHWAERLDLWRAALAERGHGGRAADNYGTVMALADMGLHETLPSAEELNNWIDKLDAHLQEETVDVGSNAEDMLVHLLSQPLDVWRRGQRQNVATWLAMAGRLDNAPDEIEAANAYNANTYLAQYGLRVKGRGNAAQLVIANKTLHQLCSLFDGTPWAAGVWSQAARRLKGAQSTKTCFARVSSRAYQVPFSSIPGLLNALDPSGSASSPATPPDQSEIDTWS